MPKAKAWERDEEIHLCQAQVNITEDRAVGTDQLMATFWDRVHRAFVELEGGVTSRNANALQTHWSSLIRPDVTLYASLHATVLAEQHSGWTDADCAHEACLRFTARREQANENSFREYNEGDKKSRKPRLKREEFRLDHCFTVLKDSSRFMRGIAPPRKRHLSHGESDNSPASDEESLVDVSVDEYCDGLSVSAEATSASFENFERPRAAGKKRAKQELVEAAMDRAAIQAQKDLAKAVTAQVAVMEQQLAVSERKLRVIQEQAEMVFMATPASNLTELGKEYLLLKQRRVLENYRQQIAREEEEEESKQV